MSDAEKVRKARRRAMAPGDFVERGKDVLGPQKRSGKPFDSKSKKVEDSLGQAHAARPKYSSTVQSILDRSVLGSATPRWKKSGKKLFEDPRLPSKK
ncbi:Oidioi.mRNA.OKI2018_I69.XSR.g14559.t1.cds [Oikopleura dioica]|uniref:Oidioi.mRNA.OKI2018_I69.XSR.g14559.t1.cds n=1 Tax=Oikopleura dioica TaxID=34765 RepID=A0ABN7SE71_OIKDI|nr:Oidioi.mRNA.OKI2018_I69.XSR.g14559.t1.cds [Oikopleura dioica]